jgi:hypothetical protein
MKEILVSTPTNSVESSFGKFEHVQQQNEADSTGQWVVFCRNVGLSIFSNIFRPYSIRGKEEPKVIINQSVLTAVVRCTVHFVPIVVTTILASFSLAGYFVGSQLNAATVGSIASAVLLLQIAAKIQVCRVV